jgi:hypothetical protein
MAAGFFYLKKKCRHSFPLTDIEYEVIDIVANISRISYINITAHTKIKLAL